MTNPLAEILTHTLSPVDVGVMRHGWWVHGRDYNFVIEDSIGPVKGTFDLTLTHVVQLDFETRVRDEVWTASWDDVFTDSAAWAAAGQPDGYLFGVDWSLAYPGFDAPETHPVAESGRGGLASPCMQFDWRRTSSSCS